MKQIIFLISLATLFYIKLNACTCIWGGPFLKIIKTPDLILQIKVADHFGNVRGNTTGMEAQILNIYKGNETRERILIWGNDGILCRPSISSYNFPVDDTFIVAIYRSEDGRGAKGETSEHYYLSVCGEFYLSLIHNKVSGFIDNDNNRQVMDLSVFEEKLLGNITDVENDKELPKEFLLEQNYPNPFNPSTIISYKLSQAGEVKILIFDLLGQEVDQILGEFQNAGTYQINFTAENLSSGSYVYSLLFDNKIVDSKTMSVVK